MSITQGIVARVCNKYGQGLVGVAWTLALPNGTVLARGQTNRFGFLSFVRTYEPGDAQAPILTCEGAGYLRSITRVAREVITSGVLEACYQAPILYDQPRKRFLS